MTKRLWDEATGIARNFADDETPGPGYIPCHPNDPERDAKLRAAGFVDPEPDPGSKPVATPDRAGGLTKAQLTSLLDEGQIEYDASANKGELVSTLAAALEQALTHQNVQFSGDETIPDMYAALKQHAAAHAPADEPEAGDDSDDEPESDEQDGGA